MGLKLILAVLIIFGSSDLFAQKVDTLKLKEEVVNLKPFNRKAFLKNIYEKDQNYRGKQANDSLDFQNLILISYFINEYGYPSKMEYGEYSITPKLVWIHNKYITIDRVTFSIIFNGYLEGEIREKELRGDLKRLYHYKIDDENYKHIPIKELLEICEISFNKKILIEKIFEEKEKIDRLDQLEVKKETLWKVDDNYKSYNLNGENIEIEFKGQEIKIIEKAGGRFFFFFFNEDKSGELRELEKISPTRYKYKGQKTERYFEFYEDKILYKDDYQTIREYKSIEHLVPNPSKNLLK